MPDLLAATPKLESGPASPRGPARSNRAHRWNCRLPGSALFDFLCARRRIQPSALQRLAAVELPAPYRQLLAHSNDMTPTLERFHGQRLTLTVLGRESLPELCFREVLLRLEGSGRPVEYGTICIHLRHFAEPVRRIIRAEEHPFGRILESEGIAHLSWPQAFFGLEAGPPLCRLLEVGGPRTLFGRRNVLLNERRRLLAEVIEILAPVTIPGNNFP